MKTYYTETKNKLSGALWRLLKSNSLEDVTITMICQEASVGRRSFYRHFQSKRDVIYYSFIEKNGEFAKFCSTSREMETMIGKSFQFYKSQKQYLRQIQQNGLLSEFYLAMQSSDLFSDTLDIFMERSMLPSHLREYVANVIAALHTSLLMTWANHDFKEDWREIVAFETSMFAAMK